MFDPTWQDTRTWIAGITIATGSSSEPKDAIPLIERFGERHGGVLDLIVGDRGYTRRESFHAAIRRYHADPVMDLDQNQKVVARMDNGALNVFGTAMSPSLPAKFRKPLPHPRGQTTSAYIAAMTARYEPYLLKRHGVPDVHGNHRMMCPARVEQVDCTQQPAGIVGTALPVIAPDDATNRSVCTNTTVSAKPADYDVASRGGRGSAKPTYQPFRWMSSEWAQIYKPARSRIESVMGSLTGDQGLHGGWRGFRVRGRANVTILAAVAAATHNLKRQGHFAKAHGTPPRKPAPQMVYDDADRKGYLRTLAQRRKVREKFRANPTRCLTSCAPVRQVPDPHGPP